MAAREAGVGYEQLHHFVAAATRDEAPVQAALLEVAAGHVGGEDGFPIVDDTALPKKGRHSVGVAPQHRSARTPTARPASRPHSPAATCR